MELLASASRQFAPKILEQMLRSILPCEQRYANHLVYHTYVVEVASYHPWTPDCVEFRTFLFCLLLIAVLKAVRVDKSRILVICALFVTTGIYYRQRGNELRLIFVMTNER